MTACDYPKYEPSRERPSGGCGQPATHAAPLGDTGRWLPLCGGCAGYRHLDAIPLSEVPDP